MTETRWTSNILLTVLLQRNVFWMITANDDWRFCE